MKFLECKKSYNNLQEFDGPQKHSRKLFKALWYGLGLENRQMHLMCGEAGFSYILDSVVKAYPWDGKFKLSITEGASIIQSCLL